MYEELIWRLRRYLDEDEVSEDLRYAADAIEHLCEACGTAYSELANVHENLEQVERERDALLKYVPRECSTCTYWHRPDGVSWCDAPGTDPCPVKERPLWEWRGVDGGADDAD